MNKKKYLTRLSIILILTGFFILFLPQISTKVIQLRTQQNVQQVENISSDKLQNNLQTETEFDFDSILEINPSQSFSTSNTISEDLILGRLIIPSIDLNLTVYNGVTNEILHAGLGTMRPGLEMGVGNFPIAGHYSRNKEVLFGNLTAVTIGDLIYLTDNEQVYEYQVYDTKIVSPTEVEWIEDQVAWNRGRPIISLMNCYYVNGKNTDNRFFVFGELISTHSASTQIQ